MVELEHSTKICRQCGTKHTSLVLVCPDCSEVLPDNELLVPEEPLYQFLAELRDSGEVDKDEFPSPIASRSVDAEIVPDTSGSDIAIRKIVFFLLVLAAIIWFVSNLQKNLPG